MGADTIPHWIVIGTFLLVACLTVAAVLLARCALRSHGEVEFELKSPSLSARLKVTGYGPNVQGEGSSSAREPGATQRPRRPHSRT
jgi:hypothetical protein